MKQIFPKEIIDDSYEVHHATHSKKSAIIYTTIVLALLGAICSLPFIYVTIYNSSRGIIKPQKERMLLKSLQSGKVVFQNLENNARVQKGDTLLIISRQALQDKENNIRKETQNIGEFIHDLRVLLGQQGGNLQTSQYMQEQLFYNEKCKELQVRYDKAKSDYLREKALYQKGVIAKVELENKELEYQVTSSNKEQLIQQQQAKWQSQLIGYQKQQRELQTTMSQLKENKDLFVLTAPEDGTLLEVAGISQGSFINAGMQLAVLSPQTTLLVECYLSPADIGLLKDGNRVSFQVDAFNYNQWGLATGRVVSIANDVQMENNVPLFKVQCELEQSTLVLKNGFEGTLKKGMTLTARFELTERSLFDLLYDKVDDWVNPSTLSSN